MTINGSHSEVCHAWAHAQSISDVRGQGEAYRSSSMSRDAEGILFSYRTPIAHRINDKCYLISSDDFSVTTKGKHLPEARRAIPYAATKFDVPVVRGTGIDPDTHQRIFTPYDHTANLLYLLQQVALAAERVLPANRCNSDVQRLHSVVNRVLILTQYYRQFRCFRLLPKAVKHNRELRAYYWVVTKALLPFESDGPNDPRIQAAAEACLPIGIAHRQARLAKSRKAGQEQALATRRTNYQGYLRQGAWVLGLTDNLAGFDQVRVQRSTKLNRWERRGGANGDPVFDSSPSDSEYFQTRHRELLEHIQPFRRELATAMPTELADICREQFTTYDPESLAKYNQFHRWSEATCRQLYDFRSRFENRQRTVNAVQAQCVEIERYVETIRSWAIDVPERLPDIRLDAAYAEVQAMVLPAVNDVETIMSPEWIATTQLLNATHTVLRHALGRYETRLSQERSVRENADKIRRWRQCENVGHLPYDLPIMLRVKDDQIQSSRQAAVPSRVGSIVWPVLLEFHRTADKSILGRLSDHAFTHFKLDVDRTTAEQLCIGCHMIPWTEVTLIAQQLGLIDVANETSVLEGSVT